MDIFVVKRLRSFFGQMGASRRSYVSSLFLILSVAMVASCTSGDRTKLDSVVLPSVAEMSPDANVDDLTIVNITTSHPVEPVSRSEKFEITFDILDTVARNLQLPYLSRLDANGFLEGYVGVGISVDALFTDPEGNTFRQPAFYYQQFVDEIRDDEPWLYPTDEYAWKVRFAPDQVGTWKYRLIAQDASGEYESAEEAFEVVDSSRKGFVRVSSRDPRYFEFEDGTPFVGLGYNLAMDMLYDDDVLAQMSADKVNFVRAWLSPFNIFGSAWTSWEMMPGHYDGYLPRVPALPFESGSGAPMAIRWFLSQGNEWYEACAHIGHTQPSPAIKPETDYLIRAKYVSDGIIGPRDPNHSKFGFIIKLGGWADECSRASGPDDPEWAVVEPITDYGTESEDWRYVTGVWNSGANNFLPRFYMSLENVSSGSVFVESIEVIEMIGGTVDDPILVGPNMIDKYAPEEHLYMAQRPSYRMDRIVDQLSDHDIYLRPVLLEKGDYLFSKIDPFGDVLYEDDIAHFYGSREVNAVRWLQQAWWRYVQARWGYSPNIHSWELLNEGDPWLPEHYQLADEFGKYMKCQVFGVPVDATDGAKCDYHHPNGHMVSTSTWNSFPRDEFWANPAYPNVDFADGHQYITENDPNFGDAAKATYDVSMTYGAKEAGGAGKPLIRGETGFVEADTDPPSQRLKADDEGIWLHNLIWAGINPGGLIESYWYVDTHIYSQNEDGSVNFDHRPHFRAYYDFIKDVPLNNGHFRDANAVASDERLRAWGQKDLVNNTAHLWIQNSTHTWLNVVSDTDAMADASGTVSISGLAPGMYAVERWDTYHGAITEVEHVEAIDVGGDGNFEIMFDVSLDVEDGAELIKPDIAVKIYPAATH